MMMMMVVKKTFFQHWGMEKTRNKNEDNKPKIRGYTKHGM